MTAAEALELVNTELARYGEPPVQLTDEQAQKAFASLSAYAYSAGRTIEVAVRDVVRAQMQERALLESDPAELVKLVERIKVISNQN